MRFDFNNIPEKVHKFELIADDIIMLFNKKNEKIVTICISSASCFSKIYFIGSYNNNSFFYYKKNSQNYFYIKREISGFLKNYKITDQQINSVCEKVFEIINN